MNFLQFIEAVTKAANYAGEAWNAPTGAPKQEESLPEKPQLKRKAPPKDEFYGDPNEAILSGKGSIHSGHDAPETISRLIRSIDKLRTTPSEPSAPDLQDEARIARRSALAGLGFDPRKFMLAQGINYGDNAGAYSPPHDRGFADLTNRSTLAHESAHRGQKLVAEENPEVAPPSNFFSPEGKMWAWWDELATRRLMQLIGAGVEDKDIPPDLREARDNFAPILDRHLGVMESLAAERIAKKRPGGPR